MWPEAEKTQELLERVRRGDQDAAGRLLQRHRDALRRMIDMRMDRKIRQRVDASDIVQDVMVEANRRLQTYLENPIMPFHLWLRQNPARVSLRSTYYHRGLLPCSDITRSYDRSSCATRSLFLQPSH